MFSKFKLFKTFLALMVLASISGWSLSTFASVRAPKGYREVYCGQRACQWKNEKTGDTLVYKKLPKNLDTRKGPINFSKKYLNNTRVGAKGLGFQVLGSQIIQTKKKGSNAQIYFKSQFRKDGSDIWLQEKVVVGKKPFLVQHYSGRSRSAVNVLDQVR
jgi:hypothetical protein